MSYYDHDVISTHAKGSAETEFVSATFTASVTTQGANGPEAKTAAQPIIEKVKHAIREHAKAAGIDVSRLHTTLGTDIDTHRQTGEFIGYKAVWTISFKATNVGQATAVHDALTSIVGAKVPSPVFHVNDSAEVYSIAFTNAVTKAKARFADQCKALGIQPDDYEVRSWTPQEEERHGKTLSFTENADQAKPVGLEPGKAALDLRVTLAFVRKPTKS